MKIRLNELIMHQSIPAEPPHLEQLHMVISHTSWFAHTEVHSSTHLKSTREQAYM